MKNVKRTLALFTACALSASLMAGCGGAAGSTGQSSAEASAETAGNATNSEIRVVTFFAGSDQWAPVWKEVIADYMEQNPGVTIIDESQPTAGANDLFRTKVQADVAAGTPADLVLFYNGADMQTLADSGLFVDLNTYLAEDPEWAGNIKDDALAAGQLDGAQYCIPYIGFYEGLFYNKGLFDQYGLEEPTTWENILACIDTFKENGIAAFAAPLPKASYITEAFILAQVGAEGQQNYFDSSWAPALYCIKELYDKGAFPADAMTMSEDDVRVLFQDEKAAMMINGSWCVSALKDNENMRIISMPTLPDGVGGSNVALSGYGSGWYMSKEAAERDNTTLDFLKYLTSPEVMTRFIAMGGSPAIDCEVPESATPLEISALDMLNTATEYRPAIDSQVTREAWATLTEPGIQYIVEGQRTPEELLAEAKAINDSAL